MSSVSRVKRLSAPRFRELKGRRPLCCLTAYDFPGALLCARAGVDLILVGDSLGNVVQGREDTLGVTLEQVLYHTDLVARALKYLRLRDEVERLPLLVADMPFLSYHGTTETSVANAGRLLAEGGAQAVKLEWRPGVEVHVAALVESGIPVMGHLGLTPQAVNQLGGYRVQGREEAAARRIVEEAHKLEAAGAFSMVLELIPAALAAEVTAAVGVPTIGIGAGGSVDGQILVLNDMLGFPGALTPRHVKRYLEAGELMLGAVADYLEEVREGRFPGETHTFE